jgi:hypothetical protein
LLIAMEVNSGDVFNDEIIDVGSATLIYSEAWL